MSGTPDIYSLQLGSPDEEVRREAVGALRSRSDEASLGLLDQALGDESWRVRKAAVEVIRDYPDQTRAIGRLIQGLGDSDNAGRRNAAMEALVGMGRNAVPLISLSLNHSDPEVRKFLVDILGEIREPTSAESVLRMTRDPVENIKLSAVEALGSIGGDRAFMGLLSLLSGDDVSLQFGALHALGRIGRPIPLDLVRPLLGKKILRRAVYDVLGWSKTAEAAELLAEGLLDSARSTKQAAVRALARVAEDAGLSEVVERQVKARMSGQPVAPLAELMDGSNLPTKRAVIRVLSLVGTAEAAASLSQIADDSISADVADALARLRAGRATTTMPRPAMPAAAPASPSAGANQGSSNPGFNPTAPGSAPPPASAVRTQPRFIDAVPHDSKAFGPMSNDQFQRVRDLVAAESGLFYEPDLKYLVERRVQRRMETMAIRSYDEYYNLLSGTGERSRAERQKLINVLSTNETYFFREDFQLKAFQEEILPALDQEKSPLGARRLRVWSAGCSSGEEPATIAMLIKETKSFEGYMVEIFGSDINEDTVGAARLGLYTQSSFRVAPEALVKKYFTPEGQRLRLSEQVRKMITFDCTNILDCDLAPHLRNLDVIFCRNVIIYFSPEAKKRAVTNFFKLLRPGGYLLLGHSESLMSISSQFELVHLKHDLVYRKPRGKI